MKRRILFVDDDTQLLGGLRNLLRKRRKQWDMRFVPGARAAIIALSQQPADVLVTDMRMPGMDGVALLHHVADTYPDTVRIVLSGEADLTQVLRAAPMAHSYLAKPVCRQELEAVIQRACDLRSTLERNAGRLVLKLDLIPPLPAAYHTFMSVLEDPNATMHTIADVLESDLGLSAHILKLANSAVFSRGRTVCSIRSALPKLGLDVVKRMVLALQADHTFPAPEIAGFDRRYVHAHAMETGCLARSLVGNEHADEAFTGGLMHEVGKLAFASHLPERFEQAVLAMQNTEETDEAVERRIMGVDHAEVGGWLMQSWGLPNSIVQAVANHHTPPQIQTNSALDPAAAVWLADRIISARADDPVNAMRRVLHSIGAAPNDLLEHKLRLARPVERIAS